MKTLVIADVHGRDEWKRMVEKDKFDQIVFLWDYFDSFHISIKDQMDNFNEIVEFSRSRDNVHLLLWNHDFHYSAHTKQRYSWYDPLLHAQIGDTVTNMMDDGELIVHISIEGYLLSHAGITELWAYSSDGRYKYLEHRSDSSTWDHPSEWPLWVRPTALLSDPYIDKQIVWHTQSASPWSEGNIHFLDTANRHYWVIENWSFTTYTLD